MTHTGKQEGSVQVGEDLGRGRRREGRQKERREQKAKTEAKLLQIRRVRRGEGREGNGEKRSMIRPVRVQTPCEECSHYVCHHVYR